MAKERKSRRERSRSDQRHRHKRHHHRPRDSERPRKHKHRRREDEEEEVQWRRGPQVRVKSEEELKKERLAKARLLALVKAKESLPVVSEDEDDEPQNSNPHPDSSPSSPVITQQNAEPPLPPPQPMLAPPPIFLTPNEPETTHEEDFQAPPVYKEEPTMPPMPHPTHSQAANQEQLDPYEAFIKDIEGRPLLQPTVNANQLPDDQLSLDGSAFSDDLDGKVITMDEIFAHPEPEMTQDYDEQEEGKSVDSHAFLEALKQRVNQIEDPESEAEAEEFAIPEVAPIARGTGGGGWITLGPAERLFNDDQDRFYEEVLAAAPEDDYLSRQRRAAEKRELKPIDHSKIDYEPFKKNFYIASSELRAMSDEQIEAFRKTNNDIKVRGVEPPVPVANWYQCGLSNKVLKLIEKRNFEKPTPIQMQAIPTIMNGRDVIGIAETGSGKTLAYVLPLLRHVLDQRPLKDGEGPIALVIAPTRQLATQIQAETKMFARVVGIRSICIYGGAGIGAQLSELKKGAEIVICTPGRMIDVLTTSNGKITNLQRVSYVCLDEADRMFDMGFEPQIGRILGNIRPDRQTVLFSATFPRSIENLAKKILQAPVEIVVGNRGQTCQNVDQRVEVLEEDEKFPRLLTIVEKYVNEGKSVLIFVDKQTDAGQLFTALLRSGFEALMLHGGSDQADREYTISEFRNKNKDILISTSVCARGLDIKHLALVINYTSPNHAEDYVHRIGRTGRAGNRGNAVTFITPEESSFADQLIRLLESSNQPVNNDLRNLSADFAQKVDAGQAYYTKKSLRSLGKGYNFSNEERSTFSQNQKEIGRSLVLEEIDGEDGIEVKTSDERKREENEKKNKLAAELLRESNAKKRAIQAAQQAASQAIMEGDISNALDRAKEAAKKSILDYRSNNPENAMSKVMKIRDQVHQADEERGGNYSSQIVINDYPQEARARVQSKEFADMIFDLANCGMSSRGEFIEPGRKLRPGQEYLYLHISGQNKQDVMAAVKEVKKVLEEAAISLLHGPQQPGRYQLPL